MINTNELTAEQIRQAGLDVLARELGPVGMARFMQQFENGKGDYSTERHEWLDGLDMDTLAAQIQQKRAKTSE